MVASSKVIRVGPWGGRGGSPWDDGPHRGVRSITVAYGPSLESMTVEYVDRNGRPCFGEKHGGGTSRSRTEKVELDFPYEFVTGVSGRYLQPRGGSQPVIWSLTLTTSRGTVHGPFGRDEGTPFEYPMEGGVVVGFTGRSSWHVDALGIYVAALRPETICDAVQERGLAAYRSFVFGGGGGTSSSSSSTTSGRHQRRRHQQQQHHHLGTAAEQQQQQTKRPFEWCYK